MSSLIEIQKLTRWYPWSDEHIFDQFDFSLNKGEFVFLVGSSGTGKTTLVKFLLRELVPPLKTIFYHQEDIARFTDNEVQNYRRKMGVIFQDYKLLESMTVLQNITYPLIIDNVDPVEVYDRIEDILKNIWLSDKKNTLCQALSGGEKQRVSIARSLVSEPEFIIADEPTGNLDWNNSKMVADSMITLHQQWHTILFITHDQRLMEYIQGKHHNVRVISL